MSSKLSIDIDSVLMDVEVLAERTKVMIEDVDQDYFAQGIKDMNEAWKVMPPYYDAARTKVDIANYFLSDMLIRMKELRELTDKIA